MEKLEATGAFDKVTPATGDRTDEGLHRVVIESIYTGVAADEAPADAAPSAAGAKPPEARVRR